METRVTKLEWPAWGSSAGGSYLGVRGCTSDRDLASSETAAWFGGFFSLFLCFFPAGLGRQVEGGNTHVQLFCFFFFIFFFVFSQIFSCLENRCCGSL